jgi:hypothetical protein
VDTAGHTPEERGDICRTVLMALESVVATFEADIPWTQASGWPADVRAAAEVLASLPGAKGDRTCARTGLTRRGDDRVWRAFATFAGYAYDASAWPDEPRTVVSLSDGGTSVALRLTEDELAAIHVALPHARLLTLREARAACRKARCGK